MDIKRKNFIFFDIDGTIGYYNFLYAFYNSLLFHCDITKISNVNELSSTILSKLINSPLTRPNILKAFDVIIKENEHLDDKNKIYIGFYTMTSRKIEHFLRLSKENRPRYEISDWISVIKQS
jgi:hypothetical protein